MRILITGGRHYGKIREPDVPYWRWKRDDSAYLRFNIELAKVLNWSFGELPTKDVVIIHGNCPTGADNMADVWCDVNCAKKEPYPANWTKYGNAAGPIRNQEMIDKSNPDVVLAFPGGAGTADCVRRARKAGIKVIEVK